MSALTTTLHPRLLKWGITLAIPLLIGLIPTGPFFTHALKLFFMSSLLVILMVAFELMDMLIPSILLPTLYFFSDIVPIQVAFSSWTSSTVWMILGALILADVLEECGLLRRIALLCIRRCGGTFTGTLYGVFITGMVVSFVTFSQAFIIMMTLTYGVCRAMRLVRSDISALVSYVGILGGVTTCTFMYNPGYLALGEEGVRRIMPEFSIVWYDILIYNGLLAIMLLGLIWLLSRMYRTDEVTFEGGSGYFAQELKALGPMSMKEKKALGVLGLLMAFLFTTPLHGVPAAYGFMTLPYLLFMPGLDVASLQCAKKTNFSIIFFIAACLGIGIVGGELGVGRLISHLVQPLLADSSPLWTLLVILTFGVLANLFMTPYAMMAALSLPLAQVGLDNGIAPMASIMSLMLATDMVFFPHECAGSLVMYGFGLISMKNFIKFSIIKTFLTYVFFVAVLFPLWKILGAF